MNMTSMGAWTPVAFSSVPSTTTITDGVIHSFTKANEKTWGIAATKTISAGFSIPGIGASASVTHSTSAKFSTNLQSTLTDSKIVTSSVSNPPGVQWVFTLYFNASCGGSSANAKMYAHTNSIHEPPCCLPFFFEDPSNPRGKCLPDDDGVEHELCSWFKPVPQQLPKITLPVVCNILAMATGKWMLVEAHSSPFSVQMTHGVAHKSGDANTFEFGQHAGASLAGGFKISHLSGEETVAGDISHQTSQGLATLLVKESMTSEKYDFQAGTAWQFIFVFDNLPKCQTSTVYTRSLAWTQSGDKGPCCLPGHFKNASITQGDGICHLGTPVLC